MSDAYKGESPAKKLARFFYWDTTLNSRAKGKQGVPMAIGGWRVDRTTSTLRNREIAVPIELRGESLRNVALEIDGSIDASLALNIPRGTISAWKAHASR